MNKRVFHQLRTVVTDTQKKRMAGQVVLTLVCSALEILSMSSIIPISAALLNKDFVQKNKYVQMVIKLLKMPSYTGFIVACSVLLVLFFLLKNIVRLQNAHYQIKSAQLFRDELRENLFHIVLNQPYSYFTDTNSSDINKILFFDISNVYSTFSSILSIFTTGIVTTALVGAVVVLNWKVAVVMGIVLSVVFFIITYAIRPISRKLSTIVNNSLIKRNKIIDQALLGIKTVQSTETSDYFIKEAVTEDLEISKAETRNAVINGLPVALLEMISVTTMLSMVVYVVIQGRDVTKLLPQLCAIALAVLRIIPGVNSIISNVNGIQYRQESLARVVELINRASAPRPENQFPEHYSDAIRVNNVIFRYRENAPIVLNNASLKIPIGSMVGIVGISGEGKTSLADLILGLQTPAKGSITVDGVNIQENLKQWHHSIGYITQSIYMLDDDIMSNVAFGTKKDNINEEKVWDCLEKAQIADFVRGLPDGIKSLIGPRGTKLSGGQRQRIVIARALYHDPQILIFDEATSSLDSETEEAVINAINQMYGKRTIIVIAHRSKALEKCDTVYRIENGMIVMDRKKI